MKTIELILSPNKKPSAFLKTFEEKQLNRGDTLRVKTQFNDSLPAFSLQAALLILLWYCSGKSKKTFTEDVEELIFNNKLSPVELEKQIKREYGILVELDTWSEEKEWKNLSATNFLRGYDKEEPEYTLADIKEPNPHYQNGRRKNNPGGLSSRP